MKKGYKSPRIYSVTIPLKMKEKASMHIKMKYTLMLIINLLHRSTKAVRFHSHPCTARHLHSSRQIPRIHLAVFHYFY